MRLRVADSAPRAGRRIRIAFLHEARNPAAGAPAPVRSEIREACGVSSFRGREKEIAGALTKRGGWILVGFGPVESPLGKLRRALRCAIKDALRQPGRGLLLVFGEGIGRVRMRALLREMAQ